MSDTFCSICKGEGADEFEFGGVAGLVAHMNEAHGEETEKGETFDKDELLKSAEAPGVDKGYATEAYGGPYKDTGTDRDEQGNIKKKKKKGDKGYGLDPATGQPYDEDVASAKKSEDDEDVNKAGKDDNDDDEDMDDEEKAANYKKKAKKSVDAAFDNEELVENVNAMPFLKSLVDSVRNAMGEMFESFWQQSGYTQGFNKSLAKNLGVFHDEFVEEIELLKAEIVELGASPMGIRKSALTPGDVQGRFGEGGNGKKLSKSHTAAMESVGELEHSEIADVMIDLVQKGEMDHYDVVRYESTKEMTPLIASKIVKHLA